MSAEESLNSFILPILLTLLMGGIASSVYFFLDFIKQRLISRFTASLTVESSDPLYQSIFDYLIEKGFLSKSLSSLNCKSERKKNTPFWYSSNDIGADSEKPELSFLPSVGFHVFFYKGIKINIFHEVGNTIKTGFERKPTKLETITLSCFGPWNLKTLKSLCEEALQIALTKDHDKTKIYALARWDIFWEKVLTKNPRPFHTVILDTNIAEEIVEDIRSFKMSQDWYVERGVPYRRGYLLYGPPGTGKTSFVLAIASELKLGICTLNLSGGDLDDEKLNKCLENTPKNSIILLEDVDAVFVDRTSVNEEKHGRSVTFSGLLNALDGVRSQEGRILFMSTNHIEKLDPALLRPGRADVHLKLDYASQDQIKRMFVRFYPDCDKALAEKFTENVPENKVSMAKLQGHFLRHKNDPVKAVENAKSLIETNDFTEEMNIHQWLFRLNLDEFVEGFLKEKIRRVSDLKNVSSGDLSKFGITKEGDKKRIMNMLNGEDLAKKSFVLMSHGSIRSFLNLFLKNSDEIEKIVSFIPENHITEYQLRDIFERDLNKKYETKVKELLEKIDNFQKKKKTVKPKETPKTYPKEKPLELLERLKVEKYIEKFIEHDVLEPELFYELDEGALQEIGLENYGLRKRLIKEIEDLKKKLELENESYCGENNTEELLVKKVETLLKKSTSIQY